MVNSVFIPFNHAPASIDYGNAARPFTCASGKYARVVVTLHANTYGAFSHQNSSFSEEAQGSDSSVSDRTMELWVTAGDVVAVSVVTASNTGTGTTINTHITQTGLSSATVTVNSQIVGYVSSSVRLSWHTNAGTNYSWRIDGVTDAKFHVENYNVIA